MASVNIIGLRKCTGYIDGTSIANTDFNISQGTVLQFFVNRLINEGLNPDHLKVDWQLSDIFNVQSAMDTLLVYAAKINEVKEYIKNTERMFELLKENSEPADLYMDTMTETYIKDFKGWESVIPLVVYTSDLIIKAVRDGKSRLALTILKTCDRILSCDGFAEFFTTEGLNGIPDYAKTSMVKDPRSEPGYNTLQANAPAIDTGVIMLDQSASFKPSNETNTTTATSSKSPDRIREQSTGQPSPKRQKTSEGHPILVSLLKPRHLADAGKQSSNSGPTTPKSQTPHSPSSKQSPSPKGA